MEVGQLVKVEHPWGEGSDQQVGWFVVGCSCQVGEVALFVEKVPAGETTNPIGTQLVQPRAGVKTDFNNKYLFFFHEN